jgi:hypothetical protein
LQACFSFFKKLSYDKKKREKERKKKRKKKKQPKTGF